jgi:Zn-dependent M28 family amino/carboxypeptidase
MNRLRGVSAVLLLLLLGFPAKAQETAANRIREIVGSIAEGSNRDGRRDAITLVLTAAHVEYELQEVGQPGRSLINIIATVPGQGPKTILLGAHYDRVPVGNGVLDNGASVAVLLNLLENLKARPAALTVRAVFFDLEELGLLGSKAYFSRTANSPKPAYAMNLDIFGYGDSFFITTSNETGAFAQQFQQAATGSGLGIRMSPPAQYPSSDHKSMIEAGIETLGIGLIDGSEVDSVLAAERGQTQTPLPRVLTIIHTARDTMDVLRLPDVTRGANAVELFIRTLN